MNTRVSKYWDHVQKPRLATKEDLENLDGRALAQESKDRIHERYVRAELKIIQNSLRLYPSKEEEIKWEKTKKACLASAQQQGIEPSKIIEKAAHDVAEIEKKAEERRITANMKSERSRKEFFKEVSEMYYANGFQY